MRTGDVIYQTTFKHCQPTIQASFSAPKGRVAVMLLLGDADKKEPDSFDPAAALHSIGWVEGTELDAALLQVAALREELLRLEEEYDTLEHANVTLKLSMAASEQRNSELLTLLRSASIDYACCLESGYDRITSLGGDCDSVEKMLADNPNYARYTAALAKPTESGASE